MPWSTEAGLGTRMGVKRFRVLRRRGKDGKVLKYPVEDRKVTFEAPGDKMQRASCIDQMRSGLRS